VQSETLSLLHQLYRTNSRPLSDFRMDHHWVRVSQGDWSPLLRVLRLIDLPQEWQDSANHIGDGQRTNSVLWFLGMHQVCFIHPLSFMGVPMGYALREVGSRSFSVYPVNGTACYTAARALGVLNTFRFHMPIVLVEGYADAEAVSQVYPFVVAMMSCSIKSVLRPILPLLTSRVYMMFDNDVRGQSGQEKSMRALDGLMDVQAVQYPKSFKDPAEWFTHDERGFRARLGLQFGG
jgi:hypothetical protein